MDPRYLRPPPPPPPPYPPQSPADPYQRPPQPSLPPPPNIPWPYPPTQQFQYQPQSQHSPSPPPPQWRPHTVPSPDHTQYPPYPSHQPPPYHYPPPRPQHVPPQSYPQDWGSGGWIQHQNWDYSDSAPVVNNNGEDWEAKAKAWAASNYPTENQHAQPQSIVTGRPEGQNYPHHQYSQPIDSHLLEGPRPLAPPSNYQQHPVVVGPPNGLGPAHFQESQHTSSGPSSYPSDTHPHYAARDGSLEGGSVTMLHQHEKSSHDSSVHQPEVPSSYSSVTGNDAGERYGRFNGSSSLPVHSTVHHHPQPHHFFGSQPAEVVTDPSDQPLSFAPHFNHHMDQHAQANFAHPAGGPIQGVDHVNFSSNYAWPPSSAPAAVYPSMPPNIQSGLQADLPASGHSMPLFPTGASFQPTFPATGASFGPGSGVTNHSAAFPADAYGVSERPKKASVPNWLREEIIKKKAAIPSSALRLPEEDTQSIEEDNDSFSRKRDQADDNRSIDSSRSPKDDNEDEEEVEAARTAAINQEIKRILTEVLLKVTDELFDEIATIVLKEDEISVEAGNDADLSNHQVLLPSSQAISKTSANVTAPSKTRGVGFNDAGGNISGPQGDILGLGNYASDEEDDEIQNPEKLHSDQNGDPKEVPEDQGDFSAKLNSNGVGSKSTATQITDNAAENAKNDTEAVKELLPPGIQHSERRSRSTEDELKPASDSSKSHKSVTKKAAEIDSDDETRNQNTRHRSDKNNRQEDHESSIGKDRRDSEAAKDRVDKKGDLEDQKHEERRGRADYHNGSKHRENETVEKTKDSESSRRQSPSDGKEGTSHTGRDTRHRGKEDNDEKRRDKSRDEKRERSRHRNESDSSRHKRHRSPSVERGRKDYSDESSDDSIRKSRQSRRRKSPSPVRSRKRQVSRSPHSKHSKRRHSPYSSHETTRGKRSKSKSRSRSRSPAHRRR